MMKEPAVIEKRWGFYLKITANTTNSILAIGAFSNATTLLWVSVCKEELAETGQSFSNFWELPSSIIWKDKQDIALFPLLFQKGGGSYFGNAERSFIIKLMGVNLTVCVNRKPAHTELVFGIRLQRRFCLLLLEQGQVFRGGQDFIPSTEHFQSFFAISEWQPDLSVENGPIAGVPDLKSWSFSHMN